MANGWTVDTLMAHVLALFTEKEKRDAEVLKRLDGVATSQEKAVTKAEAAQSDYNVRSNEFRGQLDDQAKLLMSRSECLMLNATTQKDIDLLRGDIVALRETNRQNLGRSEGLTLGWKILIGCTTFLSAIAGAIAGIVALSKW